MAIWSVLRRSWEQFRENIFKFILFNGIWFMLASFLFFLVFRGIVVHNYFMLIPPVVLLGPFFLTGLYIIKEQNFSFKYIINVVRDKFLKGLLSFLIITTFYGILIYDFFFVLEKIGDNTILLILPVIVLYLIIMFSMIQLNYWGLLVLKPELSYLEYFKKAYSYTLKNFIFSFIWSLFILFLGTVLIFSRFGIPIFFMSSIGLLIINGTKHMLEEIEREE